MRADHRERAEGHWILAHARRVIVTVVGGTVLLLGMLMIVLPGPALLVLPIGLSILATEFVWAQRLLAHAKDWVRRRGRTTSSSPEPLRTELESTELQRP